MIRTTFFSVGLTTFFSGQPVRIRAVPSNSDTVTWLRMVRILRSRGWLMPCPRYIEGRAALAAFGSPPAAPAPGGAGVGSGCGGTSSRSSRGSPS